MNDWDPKQRVYVLRPQLQVGCGGLLAALAGACLIIARLLTR
jgi:hypothetical protein